MDAWDILKLFSLLLYQFGISQNKKLKTSYGGKIPVHNAGTVLGTSIKAYPKNTLEKLELDIFSVKLIHSVLF